MAWDFDSNEPMRRYRASLIAGADEREILAPTSEEIADEQTDAEEAELARARQLAVQQFVCYGCKQRLCDPREAVVCRVMEGVYFLSHAGHCAELGRDNGQREDAQWFREARAKRHAERGVAQLHKVYGRLVPTVPS